MPYCTNCGNLVSTSDKFCAKCGMAQNFTAGTGSVPPPPPPSGDVLGNMSPRTASLLCYVPWMGWIASVVILASPRFQKDRGVRFHAFQGLYLFVAWLLVEMVLDPILQYPDAAPLRIASKMLHLVILGAWIYMMVKTSHNETYSLPVIGELAERSVAEQRFF